MSAPARTARTPGRVPWLEDCRACGVRPEFYDPAGERYGLPTYPWRWAPEGLATTRQLRARGLRPGGQAVAAQVLWWHGGGRRRVRRVAFLYRVELAKPKRAATPAQMTAVRSALLARHTCGQCGRIRDYHMPRSTGVCNDCTAGGPA